MRKPYFVMVNHTRRTVFYGDWEEAFEAQCANDRYDCTACSTKESMAQWLEEEKRAHYRLEEIKGD